jgi:uncharacterized protein (DUF1684 family)
MARFFTVVLAVGLALAVGACSSQGSNRTYAERLLQDRAAKDEAFRTSSSSPIPEDQRAVFQHLSYFPIDESYRVPASLQVSPADAGKIVKMPTSTGEVRDMVRVGVLEFMLKGKSLELSAFREAGEAETARLFVPFTDLTTGTETYAGGRYLDLDRTATGIYDLDFNKAYHPYCFYNPSYDCPYPPPQNRLPVPIRAGERMPAETRGTGAPK